MHVLHGRVLVLHDSMRAHDVKRRMRMATHLHAPDTYKVQKPTKPHAHNWFSHPLHAHKTTRSYYTRAAAKPAREVARVKAGDIKWVGAALRKDAKGRTLYAKAKLGSFEVGRLVDWFVS